MTPLTLHTYHITRLARVMVTATAVLLFASASQATDPLDADALRRTLDTLIDQHPTARRTTVTLKVVDLATGEVLYDRGGDKLLTPASTLKIYTAAAALDLLGPDYRWKTRVLAAGEVKRGVCTGDLLIQGSGDPMLDTQQLAGIADSLVKDHKLRQVRGDIRVTTRPRWQHVPLKGPGWMWDDDPGAYNMSIRSVMLNFNTLTVIAGPGKRTATVSLEPKSDWPKVVAEPGRGAEASKVRITRRPFEETIRVTGNPKPHAKPTRKTITMHDPSPWIASVFKQMLTDRGVAIRAKPDQAAAPGLTADNARPLVTHEGQTLAQAMHHFLKVSENAVGEMVLLKLAETHSDGDVSWPAGAKVITGWLINTAGLEEGSFRLVDGSGLSRYNLISADASVKLLAFMKTHKHADPFFDSLPVYKVAPPKDGSWDGAPLKTFDPERIFAKSGGMTSVSTICGYVKTLDGRWLAFSLLANGTLGSNAPARDLRNAVWQELLRFRPAGADKTP